MSAGASTARSGLALQVLITPTAMALTVTVTYSSKSPWTGSRVAREGASNFERGVTSVVQHQCQWQVHYQWCCSCHW